jgi:lipid-binding SYLF domain-containing protein
MKATSALLVRCFVPAGLVAFVLGAQAQINVPDEIVQRLNNSSNVLLEMSAGPKVGISEGDLAKARCIAVIPGVKQGAFIVGARHGAGFASCRTTAGWSAPAAVSISGGSVGLQAGGQESDIVMALLNPNAEYQLLHEGLKFGANASAMAGSVGKTTENANTDALVWSRSGGAFAGLSVNGATLKADESANQSLYGRGTMPEQVLSGRVRTPPAAQQFWQVLQRVAGSGH